MIDWYKAKMTLEGGQRHRMLMRMLGVGWNEALGMMHSWLTFINFHTEDGETGLMPDELDELLHFDRNAGALRGSNAGASMRGDASVFDALEACGWVELNERGEVRAVDFETYNSPAAKKAAQNAARQDKSRRKAAKEKAAEKAAADSNAGALRGSNAGALRGSNAGALPDKIREEYIKENGSTDPKEKDADAELPAAVEAAMTPEPEPPARSAARPANADEVADYLNTLPLLKLTAGQRLEAATAFFDEMEAVGWVNKYGRNVWQWRAAARNYATQWAENRNGAPYRCGQAARPSRNTGTYNDRDHSEYDDI